MTYSKLKIGFDLDGVILYNPARIVRPLIALSKKLFLLQKKAALKFYYPKTAWEKYLWLMLHKSSLFLAPGFEEIIVLVKQKKIQPYIITARFSYLKKDFFYWLKKSQADQYFAGCFYNKNDLQPHFFKEKMIKQLKLDIYIEDNWDIVQYLNKQLPTVKIYWIYNLLDRNNHYSYKFPNLKEAMKKIKKQL
jgi:hypothetical protein